MHAHISANICSHTAADSEIHLDRLRFDLKNAESQATASRGAVHHQGGNELRGSTAGDSQQLPGREVPSGKKARVREEDTKRWRNEWRE